VTDEVKFVRRTYDEMNGDVESARLLATILLGKTETQLGAYELAVSSTVAAVKAGDAESAAYYASAGRWMLQRGWHKEDAPR
jgi:hypothetical protein